MIAQLFFLKNVRKLLGSLLFAFLLLSCDDKHKPDGKLRDSTVDVIDSPVTTINLATSAPLDKELYHKMLLHLAHDSVSKSWPVKTEYPLPGALLPFNRIVAFYGNFYSTRMGVLGELPPDEMLEKLKGEVRNWQKADPKVPVIPALDYIAVTAAGAPGHSGKYSMRMPFSQIDKTLELAKKIKGIVILEIQPGRSTLQEELPGLEQYLKLPNVHVAIDPEFAMKKDQIPGRVIGSLDASDINFASDFLGKIVKSNNLPPKILVINRFTRGMVTNYEMIATKPEVQLVMHMDGWGFPAKKISSYQIAEQTQPVQFTGFKLFYKNDVMTPPWKTLMTPAQILALYPSPSFISYQ